MACFGAQHVYERLFIQTIFDSVTNNIYFFVTHYFIWLAMLNIMTKKMTTVRAGKSKPKYYPSH